MAIAADCKSADLGLRWFESNPAHYMFACPRWVMVPLRSTTVVAEQVPLAPSDLLRWCAGNCTEGSNPSANAKGAGVFNVQLNFYYMSIKNGRRLSSGKDYTGKAERN